MWVYNRALSKQTRYWWSGFGIAMALLCAILAARGKHDWTTYLPLVMVTSMSGGNLAVARARRKGELESRVPSLTLLNLNQPAPPRFRRTRRKTRRPSRIRQLWTNVPTAP